MRIYHFGNFYMSSIQQGIQAAHAQMEMFNKYAAPLSPGGRDQVDCKVQLFDWSFNHQTMICLNGGMDTNLQDIKRLMAQPENPYPWSSFNESEEAMKCMLTNVAIVLPERIYETASKIRNKDYTLNVLTFEVWSDSELIVKLSEFEMAIINLLNSCSLAR